MALFAMADKQRAMRRYMDRKGSGAMRLMVYIMIMSTSIYDRDNSKILHEARPCQVLRRRPGTPSEIMV